MSRSPVQIRWEAQNSQVLYWVYILYSESIDQFYKGQTNNLEDRVLRHDSRFEKTTKSGIPWILVWSALKSDRSMALILKSLT